MLCGIVDMGSNSIRLSVYQCEGGKFSQIFNKKIMAGLAGYIKKGKLTQNGIEKASSALTTFQEILRGFQVEQEGIFATASLRNVSNQDEVVNSIYRITGIMPEIISGQEEARLDFLGATHFYPMDRGLMVDIGGGSTELVWFVKNGPKEMISLPMGSLSLHTQFVEGLIPTEKEQKKIRKFVRQTLDEVEWQVQKEDCQLVCGIGGTMRMSLQLSQELLGVSKGLRTFTTEHIDKIWEIAASSNPAESKRAYRILPERMFSMVPGLILVQEIARRFDSKDFYISQAGVREGYLIDRFLRKDAFHEKEQKDGMI